MAVLIEPHPESRKAVATTAVTQRFFFMSFPCFGAITGEFPGQIPGKSEE